MTDSAPHQFPTVFFAAGWSTRNKEGFLALLLASIVILCIAVMEWRFVGLETEDINIAEVPVTLYRLPGEAPLPPVIVAHGFSGSRQMMDQISVSIARQGFLVASVDLPGHGRNTTRMSPDITSLDGTTAQLVQSVSSLADAISARSDTTGPLSFVGHSMATDVVIRAAEAREDVGDVVAISMYSPAVKATSPQKLLVLSGATEAHLRQAALDAIELVDPSAVEGETVAVGDVERRTAVAPWVGHVGVLYSSTSLEETTSWLKSATGFGVKVDLDRTGWVSGVLLAALVALVWPLSRLLPAVHSDVADLVPKRVFFACLMIPIPVVLALALLPTFGIAESAAFGSLTLIFGAWGLVQLGLLWRAGLGPKALDFIGLCGFLGFAIVFIAALDRYGAAFLVSGPRLAVFAGVLIGALPLMLADSLLVHGAPFLRRIFVRVALLVGLAGAMALAPTELGLTFTTLPVLVLYFAVFGTMARWVAARRGATGPALGKAVILAWAVAAANPLFAATIA